MTIGLGEWGFREMPIEEHFRIPKALGFRFLEFGIGGELTGRLSEHLREHDIEAPRAIENRIAPLTSRDRQGAGGLSGNAGENRLLTRAAR